LSKLLSKSPLEKKKCPLCRAVCIDSSAPRSGGSILDRMFNPSNEEMTIPFSHAPELSAPANPFVPGRPIANLVINLDAEGDTSVEDYNDFTRDIKSVRARGRGSQQQSRSQRR
jgi:hypothetical protein